MNDTLLNNTVQNNTQAELILEEHTETNNSTELTENTTTILSDIKNGLTSNIITPLNNNIILSFIIIIIIIIITSISCKIMFRKKNIRNSNWLDTQIKVNNLKPNNLKTKNLKIKNRKGVWKNSNDIFKEEEAEEAEEEADIRFTKKWREISVYYEKKDNNGREILRI